MTESYRDRRLEWRLGHREMYGRCRPQPGTGDLSLWIYDRLNSGKAKRKDGFVINFGAGFGEDPPRITLGDGALDGFFEGVPIDVLQSA